MSGFALRLARPKYFSNTSQPWCKTSNPPFCVHRWVNSHARSSLGNSIPARSRAGAAFVAARQPPALSGGGKYSPAWALGKIGTKKISDEQAAKAYRSEEKEGEFKYRGRSCRGNEAEVFFAPNSTCSSRRLPFLKHTLRGRGHAPMGAVNVIGETGPGNAVNPGRGPRSRHLQPAHGAGRGGEPVGFKPHPLQHRDEEVRERIIVLRVEADVLAVPESAAREDRRHVRRHVRVRIAQIRTINNHRAVEQGLAIFVHRLELGEQIRQQLHVPLVDRLQLRQFLLRL